MLARMGEASGSEVMTGSDTEGLCPGQCNACWVLGAGQLGVGPHGSGTVAQVAGPGPWVWPPSQADTDKGLESSESQAIGRKGVIQHRTPPGSERTRRWAEEESTVILFKVSALRKGREIAPFFTRGSGAWAVLVLY